MLPDVFRGKEKIMSMNKTIMMGRLTRDPEVRYSQGANPTAVARFSIAVNRRFKREGEPEADFFNCVAFGKLGEFVERYYRKGMQVLVTGRLQNNNYTNKDGQQVYAIQILVEETEFAESKNASGNSGNGNAGNQGTNQNQGAPVSGCYNDGFMNIPEGIDEELPFN